MDNDQTMTLVIIRHGESEWNLKNLFTGWTDVDLTDTGRKEAHAGGKAGRREVGGEGIHSSTLTGRAPR